MACRLSEVVVNVHRKPYVLSVGTAAYQRTDVVILYHPRID